MDRATLVRDHGGDPQVQGCKGVSVIPETIPYVSYTNIWVLPIAHALLYGVVANFMNYVLQPTGRSETCPPHVVTLEQRRTMKSRQEDLVLTSEFGRAYKCILKYRLEKQEIARGHPSKDMEFCVERLMARFKRSVRRQASEAPEKTYANLLLMERAIRRWAPEEDTKLGRPSSVVDVHGLYDCREEGSNSVFMGKGKVLTRRDPSYQSIISSVEQYIAQNVNMPEGLDQVWKEGEVHTYTVVLYTRGECNREYVSTTRYQRTRTRSNFWIETQFIAGSGRCMSYVGKVIELVRVQHWQVDVPPLRLAICDIHQPLRSAQGDELLR
ncbi:hypothetical protein BSKO_02869 [Bryopsis sp. KO-2023]|nr:hypothetical protein BSKO_02869 [Bryopsis sp. KO-2023]